MNNRMVMHKRKFLFLFGVLVALCGFLQNFPPSQAHARPDEGCGSADFSQCGSVTACTAVGGAPHYRTDISTTPPKTVFDSCSAPDCTKGQIGGCTNPNDCRDAGGFPVYSDAAKKNFRTCAGSAPTDGSGDAASGDKCSTRSFVFINSWDSVLPCDPATGPKITSLKDVSKLVFWLVDTLFKVSGVLAIGWFLWGSLKFVKAQGNPQDIAEARVTITQAIIGLMICLAAVAIVNFVLGVF
jgi:hypothetical protein